jgi:uncharacterized protein (DUF779 family)
MCYPDGEFIIGGSDVHLGDLHVVGIEPVPFYMSESQFAYWRHTHLTVDVVPGRGSGFSVEAPEGLRFLIRSRLLSEQEIRALEDPPARPAGTPVDPPHAAAIRRSGHGQQ